MLELFKKKLGVTEAVDTSAISAELETLRTEFEQHKETAETLLTEATSQVENLKVEKEQLVASLAEATAKLEELKQFAEAAEAEKARLIAEAETARLAARKEKIVAAVGTERADALMTATEALDDAAFSAIVDAMNVSATVEASSEMFTEIGAGAKADASKVEDADKPVHFKQYMKQ
jgi:chromosome segregation ATPase